MDLLIQDIPEAVDDVLRARARARGTTVAAEAVEVLHAALLPSTTQSRLVESPVGGERVHHDLDWFFGGKFIGQDVLDAIAEADVVHPDDWK